MTAAAASNGCYETLDRDTTAEVFLSTEHTAGPWDPRIQHGGPVAALLARAIDRDGPADGKRIGRLTVDLLGAVPVGKVRVSRTVERPGRRIELTSACLEAQTPAGGWRPAARATAWRLATQDTREAVHSADQPQALPDPGPSGFDQPPIPESWRQGGFVASLDWRTSLHGTFGSRDAPTTAWMRLARPLVAGEHTSPLEKVVAITDVANGLGARLDPFAWTFLNTDLTVQLFAPPHGSWFALEAESSIGPDGAGMSSAVIRQENGTLGRATQTLLIEPRLEQAYIPDSTR